MRLVVVESPFSAPSTALADLFRRYLQAALADSLSRGEAPFASHLMYTQALDDTVPAERERGIAAGLAWGARSDATVVYDDFGVSPGMRQGIRAARAAGRPVEYRRLGEAWAVFVDVPLR